ncbi:E3 ubiquitin-protein ligase MYLIP isoform X2 [Chironomus tepperi]
MLELRVKFWVPAHLILQENVREIFYMQARQMLMDKEIFPSDWKQAARFIALISQSEGVKFIPELLSENGQKIIANFDGCLKQKIKNIECSKGKENFRLKRNSLDEMKIDNSNDNEILNSSEIGYLEKFIIENYLEHLIIPDNDESDNNGCNSNVVNNIPNDLLVNIAREHQKIHTMTQSSAKYWLLEEFSTLQHFGEEIFEGTLISESETKVTQHRNEKIHVAVNSQGLSIKKLESNKRFSIPFSAVESAKSLRRCFHLCYMNENYVDSNLVIKFTSHRIAGTLYRALTEKHSFYSCETVHKNVETQFIRDLKGTIVSVFNGDTELGKKYVFDIRLTFRELYDNSRRILHSKGFDITTLPQSSHIQEKEGNSSNDTDKRVDLTCSICMDQKIDTLFLPCAHLSCCKFCAEKCDSCPLCRKNISSKSLVYFT